MVVFEEEIEENRGLPGPESGEERPEGMEQVSKKKSQLLDG